jgi:hypothetical protein
MKTCLVCKESKPIEDFYKSNHGKCKKCYNKAQYQSRKAKGVTTASKLTVEDRRRRNLKQNYNTTPEEIDSLTEAQGGLCAICRKAKVLVPDHKHGIKVVRGLLCHKCNQGIGYFDDSPELLQSAIDYLT